MGIRSRLNAEGSTSFRVVAVEKMILLTKITEVIPEGFAITKNPESYRKKGVCPGKLWHSTLCDP